MAMKYHPDKNDDPKAEAKFKEASEAYDVLSDSDKKAKYDRFGHAGFESYQNQGGGGFEDLFESFGDVFGGAFGSGSRAKRRQTRTRGKDIKYSVNVSLENIIKGGSITIDVARNVDCSTCSGSGCESGTSPEQCNGCNGLGFATYSKGYMKIQTSCNKCGGLGSVIRKKCKKCYGQRTEKKSESIKISVPAGIENGTVLRLSGRGDMYGGAHSPGDLYITIAVDNHKVFKRNGRDIVYNLNIDLVTAALGGSTIVPTLHGSCEINIPKGTQYGDIIKIRRKGCPVLNKKNSIGDQLNRVVLKTPQNLSSEEEELLKKFRELQDKR